MSSKRSNENNSIHYFIKTNLRGHFLQHCLGGGQLPRSFCRCCPVLGAEACRWSGELTFESTVEGRFRLISDFRGNLGNRVTSRAQHLCTQLQAPARKVRHGSFSQIVAEALCQDRTRKPGFLCQIRKCPWVIWLAMHQRQSFSYFGIARAS